MAAAAPCDSVRLWDDAGAVQAFRIFSRRHGRYLRANAELIRHAALAPGLTLLDLGAGLGGTARMALQAMGGEGRVLAVEPADAMRRSGMRRHTPGIEWYSEIPDSPPLDRLLCGAGIWQLAPLREAFARFRARLRPRAALCFNLPAMYLGEPDPPGGGSDPLLLELPARLRREQPPLQAPEGWAPPPDAAGIEALLTALGFRPVAWEFRLRLTQAAYRDWLKIPACSAPLLPGLSAAERTARIDAAFAQCDAASWRWERWRGWTAWVE